MAICEISSIPLLLVAVAVKECTCGSSGWPRHDAANEAPHKVHLGAAKGRSLATDLSVRGATGAGVGGSDTSVGSALNVDRADGVGRVDGVLDGAVGVRGVGPAARVHVGEIGNGVTRADCG